MKIITRLFITLFYMSSTYCLSQKTVDIRLHASHQNNGTDCYDVQLRSPHGDDIVLAGQNYRLFYNASKVSFNKSSANSLLHEKAYTDLEIINTETNDIGFISLSIDGRELNDKVITLSRDGGWTSTTNLCFKASSDRSYDLTWAHPDRTFQFASATVALSEWVNPFTQQILEPNEVLDFNPVISTIDRSNVGYEVRLYPNPVVDFINVEVSQSDETSLVIIKDVIGREVVYDHLSGKNQMTYDLTNWPDGIYRLEILDTDGRLVFTDKVVKTHP